MISPDDVAVLSKYALLKQAGGDVTGAETMLRQVRCLETTAHT